METTAREIPYRAELIRKAIHLLALVLPAGMWFLDKEKALLFLIPFALIALLGDVGRVHLRWWHNLVSKAFSWIMRPEEVQPLGGPIRINGATWVCLSALLLTLVFPGKTGAAALAMFMVADASAALVGRKWGRHHWGDSKKTIEGSVAFFITGTLILFAFPGIDMVRAACAGGLAAALEILDRPLNDNIQVPFMIALLLHYWPGP